MSRIDITKTELVWPGKYNEDGTLKAAPRVSLPFQVIETVNESRATRKTQQDKGFSLFNTYQGDEGDTFEEGWKNKLIWGDNLLVMNSLLKDFAGKIDLIYIDPPFATGADFSFNAEVGKSDEIIHKEQSLMEERAYRDTWGSGLSSYLDMLRERISLIRDLLSERGSLYIHTDHRVSSHVKVICDEIFGVQSFKNMISWRRQIPRGMKVYARFLPYSADYLALYTKSDQSIWNIIKKEMLIPIDEGRQKYMEDDKGFFRTSDPGTYSDESLIRLYKEGRIYVSKGGRFIIENGKARATKGSIRVKYYRERRGNFLVEESTIDNIWDDVPGMGVVSSEYLGYPTQKPEGLLSRVIELSSNPGDLVADFFCGSGTTLSVAEKLGRRWIGCDLGRWATHVTRKRLLGIDECKPFEILNLGKYERQYWQTATFNETQNNKVEQLIYEYYAFVLKLYGAQPLPGLEHIHGKKEKSLVHIGAVDAPVTINEIEQALNETSHLKQSELHILGWEWEMGLAGPNNDIRRGGLMHEIAKSKGIKLLLFQIPREVMEQYTVDKGGIQFFELAYLEVSIEVNKKSIVIHLKNFVIPNSDLIPDDVRDKITEWSDYIDYWSVDWNFQNDTFMQGWVDYRTRKDRTLRLESDTHTYEEHGKYHVLIKVIDIFGNDTSQGYDIEIE